ncbi:putative serine family amino acid catabolism-related protein [Cladochytrium replicatum]|nr:putative serine family amino acid catabolism-related protein [Cladochytrium replicatum]
MSQPSQFLPIFRHSPLLPCPSRLSDRFLNGASVYLKLDNLQPSGSFKDRGLSTFIAAHLNKHNGQCEFVSSSGGNAGLAAATTCHTYGVKCTVFVPSPTPQRIKDRLTAVDAKVVVAGDMWHEAHAALMEYVKEKEADGSGVKVVPVHPFDDPLVWKGHSSMAREIVADLGKMPDAVVTVVGGGGLLIGLAEGFAEIAKEKGVKPTTLIAVETEGAESFYNAVNDKKYPLDAITSIAKSLGATQVADRLLDIYKEGSPTIKPVKVTDRDSVRAIVDFTEEMRMLVEPACGAGLSLLFSEVGRPSLSDIVPLSSKSVVVFVVCGGSTVDFELISKWRSDFAV